MGFIRGMKNLFSIFLLPGKLLIMGVRKRINRSPNMFRKKSGIPSLKSEVRSDESNIENNLGKEVDAMVGFYLTDPPAEGTTQCSNTDSLVFNLTSNGSWEMSDGFYLYCPKCLKRYPIHTIKCRDDGEILRSPDEDNADEENDDINLPCLIGGKWNLKKLIAQGSFGKFYRAEHHILGMEVGVKILKPSFINSESRRRAFHEEAQRVAVLKHPNIVKVLDSGEDDGRPYLVMDFLQGEPLRDVLENIDLSLDECIEIMISICRAIDYAHGNNDSSEVLIHLDLKPENVIVQKIDGHWDSRVIDFGIAEIISKSDLNQDSKLEIKESLAGTPQYMGPERFKGVVDPCCDTYSLGVMLFELIAGRLPFNSDDMEVIRKLHECIQPGTPSSFRFSDSKKALKAVDAITLKALEKKPEDRYHTVGELLVDLIAYQNQRAKEKEIASQPVLVRTFNLVKVPLLVTIILLLTAFGIFLWGPYESIELQDRDRPIVLSQDPTEETLVLILKNAIGYQNPRAFFEFKNDETDDFEILLNINKDTTGGNQLALQPPSEDELLKVSESDIKDRDFNLRGKIRIEGVLGKRLYTQDVDVQFQYKEPLIKSVKCLWVEKEFERDSKDKKSSKLDLTTLRLGNEKKYVIRVESDVKLSDEEDGCFISSEGQRIRGKVSEDREAIEFEIKESDSVLNLQLSREGGNTSVFQLDVNWLDRPKFEFKDEWLNSPNPFRKTTNEPSIVIEDVIEGVKNLDSWKKIKVRIESAEGIKSLPPIFPIGDMSVPNSPISVNAPNPSTWPADGLEKKVVFELYHEDDKEDDPSDHFTVEVHFSKQELIIKELLKTSPDGIFIEVFNSQGEKLGQNEVTFPPSERKFYRTTDSGKDLKNYLEVKPGSYKKPGSDEEIEGWWVSINNDELRGKFHFEMKAQDNSGNRSQPLEKKDFVYPPLPKVKLSLSPQSLGSLDQPAHPDDGSWQRVNEGDDHQHFIELQLMVVSESSFYSSLKNFDAQIYKKGSKPTEFTRGEMTTQGSKGRILIPFKDLQEVLVPGRNIFKIVFVDSQHNDLRTASQEVSIFYWDPKVSITVVVSPENQAAVSIELDDIRNGINWLPKDVKIEGEFKNDQDKELPDAFDVPISIVDQKLSDKRVVPIPKVGFTELVLKISNGNKRWKEIKTPLNTSIIKGQTYLLRLGNKVISLRHDSKLGWYTDLNVYQLFEGRNRNDDMSGVKFEQAEKDLEDIKVLFRDWLIKVGRDGDTLPNIRFPKFNDMSQLVASGELEGFTKGINSLHIEWLDDSEVNNDLVNKAYRGEACIYLWEENQGERRGSLKNSEKARYPYRLIFPRSTDDYLKPQNLELPETEKKSK